MPLHKPYWQTLTEAVEVLHYHPNQIVRHEAAFVLQGFPYACELEKNLAILTLRHSFRCDPSIVVKHESIEAVGEFFGPYSVSVAADLVKMLVYPQVYHPDVVATAEISLGYLFDYFLKVHWTQASQDLRGWLHMANPKLQERYRSIGLL